MVWDMCLASEYIGSRMQGLELAGRSPGGRAERRFMEVSKGRHEVAWCERGVSRGQDEMEVDDWLWPSHRWEDRERRSSTGSSLRFHQ